jgi:hypothetical protein
MLSIFALSAFKSLSLVYNRYIDMDGAVEVNREIKRQLVDEGTTLCIVMDRRREQHNG